MSTQNYYEIEYPSEQLMGLSGPADSDRVQSVAKAFVEQESQREDSVIRVIWTRLVEEPAGGQEHPGGFTLKLSVLISDDDETRAWSEAVMFEQALAMYLNDVLGLHNVPLQYGTLCRT